MAAQPGIENGPDRLESSPERIDNSPGLIESILRRLGSVGSTEVEWQLGDTGGTPEEVVRDMGRAKVVLGGGSKKKEQDQQQEEQRQSEQQHCTGLEFTHLLPVQLLPTR